MNSNYPDGLSESTPGAPWNDPDPWPLICDNCSQTFPDCEVGESCPSDDDRPSHDDPCLGKLREQEACPACNKAEAYCTCEDDW